VLKLLTKGAPESLQPLLKEVPENFVAQYEHFANKGYRVLCLADKLIDESEYGFEEGMFFTEKATIVANRDRVELEQQLTFRGLLICESPLKKDTASWISKFTASYFVPLIITGDNLLTAIAVAT
jgi:cation-transporting ATPase 13A1